MELINGNTKRSAGFIRREGHSLELGVTVVYQLAGLNFAIIISRNGIEIAGRFPCVGREGIQALTDMLSRAVRHHEHLKSFAIGEMQTIIPELVFEEEEAQRDARLAITSTTTTVM